MKDCVVFVTFLFVLLFIIPFLFLNLNKKFVDNPEDELIKCVLHFARNDVDSKPCYIRYEIEKTIEK